MEFGVGGLRIVSRQPYDRHEVGTQIHRGVEVAAPPRLVEQDGPSPGKLGHLALMAQAPECECVRRVDLPGDAGATVAEDRLGSVALLLREGPSPFEVCGDAPGQ